MEEIASNSLAPVRSKSCKTSHQRRWQVAYRAPYSRRVSEALDLRDPEPK